MSASYPSLDKLEASKAYIYQSGRFLLQLRDDKPDIFYPNHWGLFGGTVDPGETPDRALVRELTEELGWPPEQYQFLFTWQEPENLCLNHLYAVPLTVPLEQLILSEGQAFRLFDLAELQQVRLVPGILDLLPQVVKAIACEEPIDA